VWVGPLGRGPPRPKTTSASWGPVAQQLQNRNVGLALTVLQRRLASSVAAIRLSLERRLKRLQDLRKLGKIKQEFGEIPGVIDVGMVERIEVVRGPSSVLYGTDAIGGVVHIITRRGSGPHSPATRASAMV
jgi:hypothetical protein